MSTPPDCKQIEECAHVGPTKMGFLSSRFSGGQASGSMDGDRKHRSTLAFQNSSRCQSSSVKSETTTETHLTPMHGSFEMDRRTDWNNLIGAEDGLSTIMHDSQRTTESSCSNSTVVVPVSFSYQSYQETSREGYLIRNCGSSIDSSNSKTFDRSPEEPVTASSESGVSAQIASKARRNANLRTSMKVLAMDGNNSSSMISKGYRKISHSCDDETDLEVVKKTNDVKCNESMKGKLPEMDKNKDESWVIESADSSTTKCGKQSVNDQDIVVVGFDLNEDITANELDDSFHPVVASVSSRLIHVVAKAGIPYGRPAKPLKFEGELGWKGTGETSAFRPTAVSKEHEHFTGIDLNVAAVEDTCHSEDDEKQAKSPWIDLNRPYDGVDDDSTPPKSENSASVDLNLADRSNNDHVYFADLRTMQHMPNNAHILQSMEHMQRHSHSAKDPLSNPFPGFLNEESSGNVSAYGPRLFPFVSKDEALHQDSWFAASLKRKEREC